MVLYKWNIAKEETDDCEQSCPKQATQDVVGDKFTIMHLTAAENEWNKSTNKWYKSTYNDRNWSVALKELFSGQPIILIN